MPPSQVRLNYKIKLNRTKSGATYMAQTLKGVNSEKQTVRGLYIYLIYIFRIKCIVHRQYVQHYNALSIKHRLAIPNIKLTGSLATLYNAYKL